MHTSPSISLGSVGLSTFGPSFVDLFVAHPLVKRIALRDHAPNWIAALRDGEWFSISNWSSSSL
ncbi:MAG TPA: hypothetical protein P5121_33470 [Caldilineaceae bacterium]|nr:hypothetical protein [Caldilineaceae bacterium]